MQLDELPQASVVVHVRVMVYSCGHDPAAVLWLKLTTRLGSQLSVAVTVATGGTAASHSTFVLLGQPLSTGGLSSSTVMVCMQLAELPQASVAV